MELVYLWVEEYKNIKRQGFNFSPWVECAFHDKYDKDGNLEDDCTLEINPKEHIENFFGDNINVTAIVGKNGSGKSSISEMILLKVPNKKHKKYIIVGYDKIKKEYHSWGSLEEFELLGIDRINTLSLDLSSSGVEICANNNRDYNHNIVYMNGLNLDFRTFKKYEYRDDDNNIFIPKYINQYKKNLNIFKNKTFFYVFDKVKLILKIFSPTDIIQDIKNFSKNLSEMDKKQLEEDLQYRLSEDPFCDTFKRVLIRFYILNSETYNHDNIYKIFLINECFEITKNDFSFIPKIMDIIEALEYLKANKLHEDIDIQKNKRYYFEFNIEDKNFDKLWIFENFFDISNFIGTKKENLPIFDLELYDSAKEITYNFLSNGEKQYIRLLIEIISNRSSGDLNSILEPKIYFFDEVETSLHPAWQKKIFNDIYNIFKIWKKNVHLIFLTHSPFLLSDIPKENVIFLDTYRKDEDSNQEEGNCKVVNGLKEKKQTFGANIHTLLSDGFFMDGGLMGEFAKGKINEIKKFYEKVIEEKKKETSDFSLLKIEYEDNQTKFEQIQSIIGEPFLKTIMGNYLDELYLIFSDDNTLIDKELQDIEARKKYLKKLKNVKN